MISSGSDIESVDGSPLDPGVTTDWAMGRSALGLTVSTLTDELDGRIDDGDISLRDAIASAAPGEIIAFDASLDGGRMRLTLGELVVTRPLTIDAMGLPNGLVIDGAVDAPTPEDAHWLGPSVFEIDDGNFLSDSPVTIRGLTLTGARSRERLGSRTAAIQSAETLSIESAAVVENLGAGISTTADLNVVSSTISGNGDSGIRGGVVTVESSTISDNSSSVEGGGILANDVTVISSIISGNQAGYETGLFPAWSSGGGIAAVNVTVDSSTISGNSATSGGGISAGKVTVNSSTISGNSASYAGGGISGAYVIVTSSTITGNEGGGISSHEDVTIRFSTIVGNTSYRGAGGVSSPHVTVSNSILAANRGRVGDLESSELVTVEYSLIGDNRGTELPEAPLGSPDTFGNLIGGPEDGVINPQIAPLQDNGGPTFTHALLPGSPAIDAGDPLAVAGADGAHLHDQRGAPFPRIAGEAVDLGAFESQIAPVDFNNDHQLSCNDVDALVAAIVDGMNSPEFDLTADRIVDRADLNVWLTLAGLENLPSHEPYLSGDIDLNGLVDASDLNVVGQNWLQDVTGWCGGDFTADGQVDARDLNLLALNWHQDEFAKTNARAPRAPLANRMAVPIVAASQSPLVFAAESQSTFSPGDRNVVSAAEYFAPSRFAKRHVRRALRPSSAHIDSPTHDDHQHDDQEQLMGCRRGD